jgi:hypothetical protein
MTPLLIIQGLETTSRSAWITSFRTSGARHSEIRNPGKYIHDKSLWIPRSRRGMTVVLDPASAFATRYNASLAPRQFAGMTKLMILFLKHGLYIIKQDLLSSKESLDFDKSNHLTSAISILYKAAYISISLD